MAGPRVPKCFPYPDHGYNIAELFPVHQELIETRRNLLDLIEFWILDTEINNWGRLLLGTHIQSEAIPVVYISTVTVLKDPADDSLAAIGVGWRARNRCGLLRYAAVPA